ncbi:zinc finger protein 665-like [Drosophila teissieri]|uniref:zinc finger protein 665-like n=1 Tax=Drosophila teissieri TaxID=7243 RepID=UPI001CBA36EA|nr:zinc finger protein 665-like [Drosophila teissieri]
MTKSKICRTCLKTSEVMVNIFDHPQYLGNNIANMVSQCIQYPLYRGDFLPETICLPCLKDAKTAFDTITKFQRSHQFLKETEIKALLDDKETGDPQFHCQVKKEESVEELPPVGATNGHQFQVKLEKLETTFPHEEPFKDDHIEEDSKGDRFPFEYMEDTRGNSPETAVHHPEEESLEDQQFQCQVKNEPIDEDLSAEEDYCELDHIDQHIKTEDIEENVLESSPRIVEMQANSRVEPERKHQCPHCPKSYHRAFALKEHLTVHTAEKPFECHHCSKRFKTARYLREHQTIHTGERPFKCTHCSNTYRKKTCLQRHIQTYTGVRPFKCTHCPKTFATDYDFQSHIRNYSGDKPYKCGACSKSFATQSVLNVHARIHTGDKPYKCTECSRAFLWNSSLQGHMQRLHSKEHPFKCATCSASFLAESSLNRHMRVHKKE